MKKGKPPKKVVDDPAKSLKNPSQHLEDLKKTPIRLEPKSEERKLLETYNYTSKEIPVTVEIIKKKGEFVKTYEVSISSVSKTTEFILEKIRQELIKRVNLGMVELTDTKKENVVEERFSETISVLIEKYFPDLDEETKKFLTSYLVSKSLGLGNIELLMADAKLEEIVVNEASEPVWIYHRDHGWVKTNIFVLDEDQTKHYAAMIGRRVGRQISVLEPLLDAHLPGGDRVNATLIPISTRGNTITLRKFSRDPWTITRFLKAGTMTPSVASLLWMAMQFELSMIIAGGTASGKTSTLNCLANFFPPNQRILSIEDTREIQLPRFLHWVPLNTRLPNTEGVGEVSMEHLLINSLRMRPDRIIVGEVRRKREAETLFEAIHTGHSVYATFHANNAEEALQRLTKPPIDVPPIMMPAISLILVQFRNRRTGKRRTFQVAEILPDASPNVLLQYDAKKDKLVEINKSKSLIKTLKMYTGFTDAEVAAELKEKEGILNYMIKNNIHEVDAVGKVVAEYYTDKANLLKNVKANKLLQ